MENNPPKEQLLPKTLTDLPLPEKEIPAHTGSSRFPIPKIALLGIVFIILLLISGATVLSGKYYLDQQKLKAINDFESCSAAGNPIQESYPATCRTSDGRSFTQVLSEEEQKKVNPNLTANWKTYSNEKFGFTFKYPGDMSANCWENLEHCTFDRFTGPGRGPENFIWFQLIPSDPKDRLGEYYNGNDIDSFFEDENSSVNTNPKFPDLAKYFTYARVKDKNIDSFNSMVFENNSPWESKSGTVERRNIFVKEDYIYVIGAYTESDDISIDEFEQILSTFKFTDPSLSCTPRPSCFDTEPRCLMPVTEDMCPPSPTPIN